MTVRGTREWPCGDLAMTVRGLGNDGAGLGSGVRYMLCYTELGGNASQP